MASIFVFFLSFFLILLAVFFHWMCELNERSLRKICSKILEFSGIVDQRWPKCLSTRTFTWCKSVRRRPKCNKEQSYNPHKDVIISLKLKLGRHCHISNGPFSLRHLIVTKSKWNTLTFLQSVSLSVGRPLMEVFLCVLNYPRSTWLEGNAQNSNRNTVVFSFFLLFVVFFLVVTLGIRV